jgi:4-amino-4-deoxy-L-arabinose transferase-like glycosyltransferase
MLRCYIRHVFEQEVNALGRRESGSFFSMLRKFRTFFLIFFVAGLFLRFFFYFTFPHLAGDSFIYGDIARNWLEHGVFGLSHAGEVEPTLIRLPGYPAFLAACFALFGHEHYNAVLLVQIAVDLLGCLVIADLARRTLSERAGKVAFALAALCPFTANYTVAPLAETLSIFFVAITLDCAVAGFHELDEGRTAWKAWIGCGLALAGGILLRPDGGILLAAVGLYLIWRMWRRAGERVRLFWVGTLLLGIAIAPLVPWTIRNWRVFHQFQPLAPRYANDPEEFVTKGFNRWMRTWIVDYDSTEEVYWHVGGDPVDMNALPERACDTPEECAETRALIGDYNKSLYVGPELDSRFAQLAEQRVARHPLRYYLWLPMLRTGDMWLRPRTEMLPLDSRWWAFADDPHDAVLATLWGAINFLFVGAAVMGVVRGPRPQYLGLLMLFVVLRSAFLGTLENPEPRYTLECFPVVLVLAAGWVSGLGAALPGQRGASRRLSIRRVDPT